jgi:diguanylate cyclase (GGDEF)-like protein
MSVTPYSVATGADTVARSVPAALTGAEAQAYRRELYALQAEFKQLCRRYESVLSHLGPQGLGEDAWLSWLQQPGMAGLTTNGLGVVTHVSPPAAALLGCHPQDVVGHPLVRFARPLSTLWRSVGDAPLRVRHAIQHQTLVGLGAQPQSAFLDAWVLVHDQPQGKTFHWLLGLRSEPRGTVFESLARAMGPGPMPGSGWVLSDDSFQVLDMSPSCVGLMDIRPEELLARSDSPLMQPGDLDADALHIYRTQLRDVGSWSGHHLRGRVEAGKTLLRQTVHTVVDATGKPMGYLSVMAALDVFSAQAQGLTWLLCHDAVTGLPNDRLLQDELTADLEAACRRGQGVAVLSIEVNVKGQALGSLAGDVVDDVLRDVAIRLQTTLRHDDLVAHTPNHRFVAVVHGVLHRGDVLTLAKKVLAAFGAPTKIDDRHVLVTARVGCARYPFDGEDAPKVLQNAHLALDQALSQPGCRFRCFDHPAGGEDAIDLGLDLWGAAARGELQLVYQPQVARGGSQAVCGCEALLRWTHPVVGAVPPDRFIPLAEANGSIIELGEWVVSTACRQLTAWKASGHRDMGVSVNVSSRQLDDPGFASRLTELVAAAGAVPHDIELEVTESFALRDAGETYSHLSVLRKAGFKIAIDDFGVEYSSLARLKDMPIDRLKIDRQFVHDLAGNPNAQAISRCFVGVGQAMGMTVIAEGVESAAQMDVLTRQGCDIFQGFLIGHPMSAEGMSALLEAGGPAQGQQ